MTVIQRTKSLDYLLPVIYFNLITNMLPNSSTTQSNGNQGGRRGRDGMVVGFTCKQCISPLKL